MATEFKVLTPHEHFLLNVSITRLNALEEIHSMASFTGLTAEQMRDEINKAYETCRAEVKRIRDECSE